LALNAIVTLSKSTAHANLALQLLTPSWAEMQPSAQLQYCLCHRDLVAFLPSQ
jgi:hypothetical protein